MTKRYKKELFIVIKISKQYTKNIKTKKNLIQNLLEKNEINNIKKR